MNLLHMKSVQRFCLFALLASTLNVNAQDATNRRPAAPSKSPLEELLLLSKEIGPRPGAVVPKPSSIDSRLVVFPYNKDAIYPVKTWFSRFTHFEFASDEQILSAVVNDESEWEVRVLGTGTDLTVRPTQSGASGSMLIITTARRYQIDLVDVLPFKEARHQRVSWRSFDSGVYEDRALISQLAGKKRNGATRTGDGESEPQATSDAMPLVSLDNLNMEYSFTGEADFKPIMVFDDGKRTWIKFKDAQPMRPIMFAVSPEGMAENVEYAVHGPYFITAKIFQHGILLKSGAAEIKIRNQKTSSCGVFDSSCRGVAVKNFNDGGELK